MKTSMRFNSTTDKANMGLCDNMCHFGVIKQFYRSGNENVNFSFGFSSMYAIGKMMVNMFYNKKLNLDTNLSCLALVEASFLFEIYQVKYV
jgi:hypothetical protein